MFRDLKLQLKTLQKNDRLNPDRAWVSKQRELLLGQISATTEVKEHQEIGVFEKVRQNVLFVFPMFMPDKMGLVARPIMTVVLVFALAAGGWIATVSASYKSIPGDRLYQVKLATETVGSAVSAIASSEEEKMKKDIDRAEKRTQEIKAAVQKVQEDPSKKTRVNKAIKEVAVKEVKASIQSAEHHLQNVVEEKGEESAEVAKEVSERTDEINKTLREVATEQVPALEEGGTDQDMGGHDAGETLEQETVEAVTDTVKTVSDVGMSALVTAVEQSQGNDSMKEVVEKKIEQLSQDAKSAASSVSTTPSIPTLTTPTSASSTIATQTITTEVKKVDGLVQEASQLIQENKLGEAIEKVLELHQVTTDVEQAAQEVQKQASQTTVSPAIGGTTIVPTTATNTMVIQVSNTTTKSVTIIVTTTVR